MNTRTIAESLDEQTGRYSCRVGKFTYTVEGYDSEYIDVHKDDKYAPIFVREIRPKVKANLRYAKWEEVCDVAYKMARLQSQA